MAIDGFDLVIVGAGSAGAVLAARLAARGDRRVLLLEAGPVEPDPDKDRLTGVTFAGTRRDWGFTATARPGRTLEFPQGRAAGGGSAVNMALALRPLPEDIDAWAAAGNPGWGWADLEPCLRRLERDESGAPGVHGTDGPVPIVRWSEADTTASQRAFREGCVAVGLPVVADHNDGVATGVGPFPMNRDGDIRVSTAIAYLQHVLDRPTLEVRGEVMVDRVLIRDGRARGVRYVQHGEVVEVAADEVVVCAGAINSPALLWRSGIGPAASLRALGIDVVRDAPGVGANLMEHPGAFLFVIPEDGVCDTSEVQFQLGARTTAPGSSERNDLLLGMMSHWDLRATPDFRDLVGADVIFSLTCGVLSPRSRGSVTLTSADPAVAPSIDLALCDDPWDTRRLVAALRLQYEVARSSAMRGRVRAFALIDETVLAGDDDTLGELVRASCAPWYHPSGTCRMGPRADDGDVVDAALRVHGVDALRVADASIMPTIPRATTNLTAIAIGERAAEIIG